ncbi:DUF6445 family protein [Brevibacillus borstelensis]|uniref:DUF6445 family protein n=1 Tax=Brevibacillus borstelensis TaxID=45462 RepID=UPI0030C02145
MLPKDIIIIDGFYTEPDKVRQIALRVEYTNFGYHQNFPGAESTKAYFSSDHKEKFESLVGSSIEVSPEEFVFGKFRYSTKYDIAPTSVHLDYVDWTGVVYLTLDENCKGGLGIYRHRQTGLLKVPENLDEMHQYECNDLQEFDRKYVYPQSNNIEAWELIFEIPIRFNRLILFPGKKYFHGITQKFGSSINDSRLTQNFFFKDAR